MNTPPQSFNTAENIAAIVPNVFETMLGLQAVAADTATLPTQRISGAIGIAGETVNGTVYIHMSEALGRDVTRAMLQCTPGQNAGDNEVNDVIGELSNMIGCKLKSLLNDADIFCAISTPSVIRGAFAIEAPPDVHAEKCYFSCLGQRFAVEVHLQILDAGASPI